MLDGVDGFAVRDIPAFPERSARLLTALSKLTDNELQRLWQVSDRLLKPCLDILHLLKETGIPASADELADPAFSRRISPALFSYVGLQYQSMAPAVLDESSLAWLQSHLRILSGFYGCVRPFDAVLPYRLEMCAPLAVDGRRNLYGYWGGSIADAVCAPDGDGTTHEVINLASAEYARAVLPHLPSGIPAVTCLFGEFIRNGRPVQRATASKMARGSMVRWMAERRLERAADLTAFDVGYRFDPALSHYRGGGAFSTLVFMRATELT